MLYLEGTEKDTFQEIVDNLDLYYGAIYRSVERLKELGLATQEISSTTKPPSNIIRLTEKGKLVSKKLKEIEEILKGNL